MADNQVALSRMTRATNTSLSKGLRQNVPPFLQKLYEMVSDSATDNLIRWSENGDSFFVLDHERVAHDVLPRWFKHSNFASFVRQLNMYGFHKIPHLQQGVLKSDTETEIWNFEHPNFRRGQPDLLCLITRKKQAQERQNDDVSLGEKDGNTPGAVGGFNPGTLVDINSIINGITAIKRHQATISADLNELRASNQHLWQEAIEARERHQKQQDTINRILKFLAGVFGNAGAHKGGPMHDSSHAGIPRKRQRLMIEGVQSDKDKPLEPLDGIEPTIETTSEDGNPTDRFVEVTPSPVPSKAASVVPETPNTQTTAPHYPFDPPQTADIVMGGNFPTQQPFIPFSASAFPQPDNDNVAIAPSYPRPNDSVTPTALTSSSPSPREELLQSIVNSPGAMQRLLSLLNLQQQQNIPMPPPLDLNDSKPDQTEYIDNSFSDPYAHPHYNPPPVDPTLPVPPSFDVVEPDAQTMSLLRGDDLSNSISFDPYIENANRLKKTSDASAVIAEHVNMMDSNIDSLMKHLGLDPQQLEGIREDEFGGVANAPSPNGGGTESELFNHDQNEQQQQQQQTLPNRNKTGFNASSGSDSTTTGVNGTTSVSSNNVGPTPAVPNTTAATTNPPVVPFQPTVPDFDFSAFLNELAKQNGETSAGPGFGDYKPDLDTLMMDAHAVNNNVHTNGINQTNSVTTSPQLSAFVDEIASQSGQSDISTSPPRTRAGVSNDLSPNVVTTGLPDITGTTNKTTGVATRKRKSEVESEPPSEATTPAASITTRAQTKTRRKR